MDVHCGQCGRPLALRIDDVKAKRTIDCAQCEKKMPDREAPTRGSRMRRQKRRTKSIRGGDRLTAGRPL